MENALTLYSFPVSHFAEKVRWLFDDSGIAYQEVNWVPLLHAPAAYWKSGKRTIPFVEVKTSTSMFVVHDSTAIIEWTFENYPGIALAAQSKTERKRAMEFEAMADKVGADVIRYMYAPMIRSHDDFIQIWGWHASPMQRRLLRMGMPVIRYLLDDNLDFSDQGRKAGLQKLHNLFATLDEALSDGRDFLVGDALSIADVSVCSILAPIFTPELHEVYSSPTFQRSLTEQQSEFRDYNSYRWMQNLYRRHRRRQSTVSA